MPAHDPLCGPKSKIERAKSHVRDLDRAVKAFIQSKPYTMFEEDDPDGVETHIKVRQWKPLPKDIGLISADAIHNLRVSLDHLACVLAEANGATSTSGTYFPLGRVQRFLKPRLGEK